MYQIPSKQLAVKLSDFERNQLQEVSDELQEKLETTFSNGNHVVFGILQELKTLETNLITAENKVKSLEIELETLRNQSENKVESNQNQDEYDLQPLFELIRESLYGAEEEDSSTNEELLNDVLGVLSEEPPKPQTIEKVVEKEIERSLSADEILLKLTEKQIELLNLIARWRHSKKIDPELKKPGQIIEAMVFNKGALLNWGEGFRTGIKRKNLG
ncbi:hypothetical protein [Brumimicrobium mesophilum]|uniref:hypothetical protein n=1 Tax=Brumimicrobium mesophilum TaxID=392717 RepID=UPI000D142CA1|nr:hypothetical protein [Brumimicrobium mesophilum]